MKVAVYDRHTMILGRNNVLMFCVICDDNNFVDFNDQYFYVRNSLKIINLTHYNYYENVMTCNLLQI